MGFRFQKRIKLLPGVSINLSKSGVSTSLGPKGTKVTLGHGKRKTTFGLPGTGISHTSVVSTKRPNTIASDQLPPAEFAPKTNRRGESVGRLLAGIYTSMGPAVTLLLLLLIGFFIFLVLVR